MLLVDPQCCSFVLYATALRLVLSAVFTESRRETGEDQKHAEGDGKTGFQRKVVQRSLALIDGGRERRLVDLERTIQRSIECREADAGLRPI